MIPNKIVIENIEEFKQQIINDNLVLTRIYPFINEITLFEKDLEQSFILKCFINGVKININDYKNLLVILYYIIDKKIILKNSILTPQEQINYNDNFDYYSNLCLSIQNSNFKKLLKEIINISRISRFKIELKIRLKNNEIFYFAV